MTLKTNSIDLNNYKSENLYENKNKNNKLIHLTGEYCVPGLGYDYLKSEVKNESIFNFLDKEIFNDKTKSINNNYFDPLLLSSYPDLEYTKVNKNKFSIDHISNLSELKNFISLEGVKMCNLLINQDGNKTFSKNENPNLNKNYFGDTFDFLNKIRLDGDKNVFFVKILSKVGEWKMKEQNEFKQFNENNNFLIRKRFGDSFIKSISYGSLYFFKIDMGKENKNDISTKTKLRKFLSHRNPSYNDIGFFEKHEKEIKIQCLNPQVLRELTQINNIFQLRNFVQEIPEITERKPIPIVMEIEFYNVFSSLNPEFHKEYKKTIDDFDTKHSETFFDLLSCSNAIDILRSRKNNFSTEKRIEFLKSLDSSQKKVNIEKDKIKLFFRNLKSSSWYKNPFLFVQTPKEIISKNPFLYKNRIFNDLKLFTVETDLPKTESPNDAKEKTPNKEEPKADKKITWSDEITLFTELHKWIFTKNAKFVFDEVSPEVLLDNPEYVHDQPPKYVIFLAEKQNQYPNLYNETVYGLGEVVYVPRNTEDLIEMVEECDLKRIKYVKVYVIEDSEQMVLKNGAKYSLKTEKSLKRMQTMVKPRNISAINRKKFILHKSINSKSKITKLIDEIAKINEKTLFIQNIVEDLIIVQEYMDTSSFMVEMEKNIELINVDPKVYQEFCVCNKQMQKKVVGIIKKVNQKINETTINHLRDVYYVLRGYLNDVTNDVKFKEVAYVEIVENMI